jgi:hypothetical protein
MADRTDDALPVHVGAHYLQVLEQLHRVLLPATYLEIGTEHGTSLAVADCAAIAIDPFFQMSGDPVGSKPACHFFQMGSDAFFKKYNPEKLLGQPVDIAFLDGMHWFEFLLRDFINIERHCQPNSIVVMHDCIPTDAHIARRNHGDNSRQDYSTHPEWWAGDVWKVPYLLRQHRKDLVILAVDAPPTGLVLVTNLDPENNSLGTNYFRLIEEARPLQLETVGFKNFSTELGLQSTSSLMDPSLLASKFWL